MKKIFYIITIIILLLLFFTYISFSDLSSRNFIKSFFVNDEGLQKCLHLPTGVILGYGNPQKDCLFALALEREDMKICENSIGGSIQECQRNIAIKTENVSLCTNLIEIIKKTSYPNYQIEYAGKCYYKIALAKHDPSICAESTDEDVRLYCDFHFETEKITQEIIARIHNPQAKICDYTGFTPEGELDGAYYKLMYTECGKR